MHLYAVYEDTMIAPDGTLNREALDKFDYFIAELKKVGIYTYIDLNDGMLYDRLLGRKLPAPYRSLKMASLFNRDLIEAQKKLARSLFTHRNPYTGLRLCDDPAVALYEITNENSLTSNWGSLKSRLPEPYYAELERLWKDWLRAHGKPERPLPTNLGDVSSDARRFAAGMQKRYLDEMYDFLRGIGVKAPICGTNITFTLGDLWASERMDYTNDHAYWDHPNVRARPMTYSNRAAVQVPASNLPMISRFARAKVHGKPVVASEWNYCFPNDYRSEGLPTMAAYGAYQDWDGLLFYCATGSFDSGRWERFHDRPGILIHSQQTDPSTWGLSQICALLFRRGDVQKGKRLLTLTYDETRVWQNRSVLQQMPFLPGLVRVETRLSPARSNDWFLSQPPTRTATELYPEARKRLGVDTASETILVNDTGQIRRDASTGILTIDTPRSQVASGYLSAMDRVSLSALGVRCSTRFATIAATSLDGEDLNRSHRVLLAAVANARNADTRLEAHRIMEMGRGPVLAEPVEAEITLKVDSPSPPKVWALDPLTGRRKGQVPATLRGQTLSFRIGGEYETIYYEVVAE